MQARGALRERQVAPYTGAWIETFRLLGKCLSSSVAPYTGAWIETYTDVCCLLMVSSLPIRGRGLKQSPLRQIKRHHCRSLYGGVD